MKKSERGFIDPYGLGFIVIVIGSLIGGIQDSWEDKASNNSEQNSSLAEPGPNHATSK